MGTLVAQTLAITAAGVGQLVLGVTGFVSAAGGFYLGWRANVAKRAADEEARAARRVADAAQEKTAAVQAYEAAVASYQVEARELRGENRALRADMALLRRETASDLAELREYLDRCQDEKLLLIATVAELRGT